MAKRKRASLKRYKSPESLGRTQKKGKGIDVLFGGPTDVEDMDRAAETDPSSLGSEAETSAVGASLDTTYDDRPVDELGLPVALEAPPDDLILASSPETLADEVEVDVVDPNTSPFAMPVSDNLVPDSNGDANDFSGIMEDDSLPPVEEAELPSSALENELSGAFDDSSLSDAANAGDLSGIVEDVPDVTPDPGDASAVPPPPPVTFPPPPAPPPTTAAPINVPPPAAPTSYEPAYEPATPAASMPPVASTPASPAAEAGSPEAEKARLEIDSITGIATEKGPVSSKDILPEDALTERGDHILAVEKRSELERDDAISEKVLRYIGRERREKLDQEIEELYSQVAEEMSDSKEDSAFALRTLSEAQDIVLEDPRQYDEALYRVAVVKTMLVRKRNLRRWSYSWGMFVFLYAVIWLAAFIVGFFLPIGDSSAVTGDLSAGVIALRAAWLSSLAGGIGGTIAILYSLSWRVAIKHEFDRQYIMKYLVQPIMGFILGAMIFFVTTAGFLFFGGGDRLLVSSTEGAFLGVSQLVALQILLGFIAGFRQRVVYYIIDRIVKRLSPTPTESKEPSSVVPTEDLQHLQATPDTTAK